MKLANYFQSDIVTKMRLKQIFVQVFMIFIDLSLILFVNSDSWKGIKIKKVKKSGLIKKNLQTRAIKEI